MDKQTGKHQRVIPVSVSDVNDKDLTVSDDNLIKWIVDTKDFQKSKFEITQDYESLLSHQGSLSDPVKHTTEKYDKFIKHFTLCKTVIDVELFELYNFVCIGTKSGICQPHVNYHCLASDIEPGIRDTLNHSMVNNDDTGWTFELVLLSYRTTTEDNEIQQDELRMHNTKTREIISNKACKFVSYDMFPFDEAKNRVINYLEGNFSHPKPSAQQQIDRDEVLPYHTAKDGIIYFWGVMDGLQRLSPVIDILNSDAGNAIGRLKVKLRLYATVTVTSVTSSITQNHLLQMCCDYSKEIANNNHVISRPSLCSELSSIVMKAAEGFIPRNINFKKESKAVFLVLAQKMTERFYDKQIKEQIDSLKDNLSKDESAVYKDLLKAVEVKRNLVRMLYTKNSLKKKKWMESSQSSYYSLFLYCLFICYYQDNKILNTFEGINKIFDFRLLVWIITVCHQFVLTYLPHSLRKDNRSRIKCLMSLLYIPFKDVITSLNDLLLEQDLAGKSAIVLRHFISHHQQELSSAAEGISVEPREVIIPCDATNFIDILLHKYLLVYLSIDSVRHSYGYQSSDSCLDVEDHFTMIQFPFLDKSIMATDKKCVDKAESILNTLIIGQLFSNTLQRFCWCKRDGITIRYPLTLRGFIDQINDLIFSNSPEVVRPINKLPLELFSVFKPPLETVHIQTQVGGGKANCVVCAINNLFGKACVAINGSENQRENVKALNKSAPIYLEDVKVSYPIAEASTNPSLYEVETKGFSLDDGCSYSFFEHLVQNELGCTVMETKDQRFNEYDNICCDKNFIGFVLIGRECNGLIGHYMAMRKVQFENDVYFTLLDSYEKSYFGLFRYDDIICSVGQYWRIYAVLKTEKWSAFDFMDLETDAAEIVQRRLPFMKYSKFFHVSGLQLMSESFTYLTESVDCTPLLTSHAHEADNNDDPAKAATVNAAAAAEDNDDPNKTPNKTPAEAATVNDAAAAEENDDPNKTPAEAATVNDAAAAEDNDDIGAMRRRSNRTRAVSDLYKPDNFRRNNTNPGKGRGLSPVKKKMKKTQKLKKKRKRQQDHHSQKSKKKRKQQVEEEGGNDPNLDEDLYDFTDSDSAIDTVKYQHVMKKFKLVALKCKQDEDLLEELDNFILSINESGIVDDNDGNSSDNENDEYSQKNSLKLLCNEPRVHHKRLKSRTDNQAVGLLLKELNKKYSDCLSLRHNTERTIEIDLDKLLKNNLNNSDDLKELVRVITVNPDVTIILTNLPDIGEEMLSILENSRFGKYPNAHLRLFHEGRFLGNTTKLFSLNHVLDTCKMSTADVRNVQYEIAKDDGTTREVVDMQESELSLYFSDISTDRANPGMMEKYKNAMPEVIKDLLPYEINDFSKYLNGQNKSDQPGPNIYVATKDAFTGLHVDNSYAVLAVHHNLIGTNKVTIFRALNDIESAESFWNDYKQYSRKAGLIDQQPDNGIFDILKYSSQMSDEMIRSMEGETFLLKKNEVLLISCGRPHVFQKMGCYDSIHFSIAWDIIAFDIEHEDMFTMDLMRGLMFSAEKCKRCRVALGELEVEPDTSYVRSCLMNYLLKAPLQSPQKIPQAYMFPLYVLVREQLEYKLLCIHHKIKEICVDMFPEAKSYYCDTCGMDLCNAYFISKQKQNDAVGNTFCSHCIEMALLDQGFVENNREKLADILTRTKKHPRVHPESSLILMYRYMDIDDLMTMCGLFPSNAAKDGSNFYQSCYESLSDVENFPTESTAKQICKVCSDDYVIHGKGLVAIRDISANTFIAELKGDIKPRGEVKHDNFYCADLLDDKVIDPHETECLAKYVNHSCQPNAALIISTPKHIFIVSGKEPILAGTEITVDYGNRHEFFEACLCPLCEKTS